MENVAVRIAPSNIAVRHQPSRSVSFPRTARTTRALPTPALTAWKRELANGQRTTATFDALWRAAGYESSALECERDGLGETAAACRKRAREIMRAALMVAS